MCWKKLPYWLKWGIGIIPVVIITSLVMGFITQPSYYGGGTSPWFFMFLMPPTLILQVIIGTANYFALGKSNYQILIEIFYWIYVVVFWFLIGALIGFVIRKLRKKSSKK